MVQFENLHFGRSKICCARINILKTCSCNQYSRKATYWLTLYSTRGILSSPRICKIQFLTYDWRCYEPAGCSPDGKVSASSSIACSIQSCEANRPFVENCLALWRWMVLLEERTTRVWLLNARPHQWFACRRNLGRGCIIHLVDHRLCSWYAIAT